ncbi:hypothetical protein MEO_04204, partial [Candida albicans P94015]
LIKFHNLSHLQGECKGWQSPRYFIQEICSMSEVPNQESPSSSILKQSNASSSTKVHGAPSSSQIANVDFNTLRKLEHLVFVKPN